MGMVDLGESALHIREGGVWVVDPVARRFHALAVCAG
jgi:hypothetical protein